MQYSTILRTNIANQLPATLMDQGGQPLMKIFNGPLPPSTLLPDPANILVSILLPAVPLIAGNGVASLLPIWQANAIGSGAAQCFRMYDALSVCHIQGYMSEQWLPSVPYIFGQQINNSSGVYRCVLAGVSASVGTGPIGVGSAISDGSAQWQYLAQFPDIILISTIIQASEQVTVTNFSVVSANA